MIDTALSRGALQSTASTRYTLKVFSASLVTCGPSRFTSTFQLSMRGGERPLACGACRFPQPRLPAATAEETKQTFRLHLGLNYRFRRLKSYAEGCAESSFSQRAVCTARQNHLAGFRLSGACLARSWLHHVIYNRINALSSSFGGESRVTKSGESLGSTAAPIKLLRSASVLAKAGVRFGVSQTPTVGSDF